MQKITEETKKTVVKLHIQDGRTIISKQNEVLDKSTSVFCNTLLKQDKNNSSMLDRR